MRIAIALVLLARTAWADEPVEPPTPRLRLDLELFADLDWIRQAGPDLTQLRLDRGEAGVTIGLTPHEGAELRLESIRSAADGGTLGIAGDSLVVRVKRAQVFTHHALGDVRLGGAIGVVPDPWIAALEDGYSLRPLSATASEGLLGWSTGDLAALGRVAYGPARLSVSVGNGEGLRYPERNDGKTTTAVLELEPYRTADQRLRLLAVARDGSIGPARVRDHRFGGGATYVSPFASAGVEVVRAYGVGDRNDVVATSGAAWLEVRPTDHAAVALRGSTIRFAGGSRSSGQLAIACDVDRRMPGRLRAWLALDRTTSSGTADPVPQLDPGDATTLMFIVSTSAPYVIE